MLNLLTPITLAILLSLSFSLASPSPTNTANPTATPNALIILDTGVGHRSIQVPRWRTSLRSISTHGDNATTLQQYGPVPPNNYSVVEPIGATDLAQSRSTHSLFLATGSGIQRTALDGSNAQTIISTRDVASIAVAERSGKLYFGTSREGLIWRSNLDGSGATPFRNVSQGSEWGFAKSFPAGILVDEDSGWVYWSASRGPDDGSIRRVRITGAGAEQVLLSNLDMPRQLRIAGGMLYWCEMGRWSNSPTSLSRARLPSNTTTSSVLEREIMVHSNHTAIFFEKDFTGDVQTLGIRSFAFSEKADRLWFVMESSSRTMFAKLAEIRLKTKALKLMNWEPRDLGIPVAIEYVKQGKGNGVE
jgi:hypothetical protein